MRQRPSFLVPLALLLAACTDYEKLARDDLAEQKLTDVKLTSTGRGKFDFTAIRNGAPCKGSIGIQKGFGKTTTDRAVHCEPVCNATTPEVCFDQGLAFEKAKDLPKARAAYEKGCEYKHGPSCVNLGLAYERGDGGPKDQTKALTFFEKSCELKNGVGCRDAAVAYDNMNPPKLDLAFARAKQGCSLGDDYGCYLVGRSYLRGRGVEADRKTGLAKCDEACAKGVFDACDLAGVTLILKSEHDGDARRGEILMQQACDKGSFRTCTNLGTVYRDGPLPKDPKRANALFEKACSGKNGWGCNEFGAAVSDGDGVDRDEKRGVQLFKQGCELDDPMACWNYGRHLRSGGGVAKDPAAAQTMFVKACNLGNDKACKDKDAG